MPRNNREQDTLWVLVKAVTGPEGGVTTIPMKGSVTHRELRRVALSFNGEAHHWFPLDEVYASLEEAQSSRRQGASSEDRPSSRSNEAERTQVKRGTEPLGMLKLFLGKKVRIRVRGEILFEGMLIAWDDRWLRLGQPRQTGPTNIQPRSRALHLNLQQIIWIEAVESESESEPES